MSAAVRRPDAVVATVAQSRARIPGTSSTGQEMTNLRHCWCRSVVAEEWIEKVFEVQRVSYRIILVKLIVGQRVVTFCLCMPHRVQASFHAPSVALVWAATASSAMAASMGAQEMQWAQALEKKNLTTDVHGVRELHAPWMADHRRRSRADLTSLRW